MFINLCAQKILETMKSKSESCSNMSYSATPWTVAHQAPLSMGFSRQEYWSGLPFPPPGDLPDPVIEPTSLASPALTGRFSTTSATWEAPVTSEEGLKDFQRQK